MTTLPPPPPPAPPVEKKRRRWPYVVGAIVVLAVIGAALADDEADAPTRVAAPTAPATTPVADASVSDEEAVELLVLSTLRADMESNACPPLRELVAQGADIDAVLDMAVREFEGGYGNALTPGGNAFLRQMLRECL